MEKHLKKDTSLSTLLSTLATHDAWATLWFPALGWKLSMRTMSGFGYSASLWKAHSERTRGMQGMEVYVDCPRLLGQCEIAMVTLYIIYRQGVCDGSSLQRIHCAKGTAIQFYTL